MAMAASCSGDGRNRRTLSLLGSATRSVLDFVRTELRTMLAIAVWVKRTSRRAQGFGRVRRTPQRQRPAPIASRSESTISPARAFTKLHVGQPSPPSGETESAVVGERGKTSKLGRIIIEVLACGKGRVPGNRLQSNRWVGWVEESTRVGRVRLGKAHVLACAGLGG